MAKSLEELRADAEASSQAYQDALDSGDDKLNRIAQEQDKAIRPRFKREAARDEHGNPVHLDQHGNPEWRGGQKIEAARARPVYVPPLRSPLFDKGAAPPDIDHKNAGGSWDETEALWLDLVDVLTRVDNEPLTQEDRESCTQQLVPSLLDRLATTVPRIDCAFPDGPMGKGSWLATLAKYQLAFNPSKTLERSIGTMRTRTAPKFVTFALEGAKWLFRRCPSGVPQIKAKPGSDTNSGPSTNEAPRKRGRPFKNAKADVKNLE